MTRSYAMVVDFGRRRLQAMLVSPGRRRGSLKVRRALVEDFPADLPSTEPEAMGRWIRERLRAARFPKGKATIALGRENVGVKLLTLPTAEDAELPDMTRLAVQRELPFDADDAAIDFLPIQRDVVSTTVLAVAAPVAVIDFARTVAKAAGLNVERIGLRSLGAAVVASTMPAASPQAVASGTSSADGESPPVSTARLAIDVLGDAVEFCVIGDGEIRFSRFAEVPQPCDRLAVADAVVTETRRTWMSYRVGADARDIAHALIMGDHRVSEYAAAPLGDMLGVPVAALCEHPLIEAGDFEMDRLWPLAGLLMEPALGRPMIDFAKPRRAPDVGAKKRQRRLVIAGVAVVGLLAAWTTARRQLNNLERQATELTAAQRAQLPDVARYWRDQYKLQHLKTWEASRVDWLDHARYLTSIAPSPDRLVLDSWSGDMDFGGVRYDKSTGRWSADQQLTIVLDGEAKDRETADGYRAALVQNSIYATATPGADAKGGKRLPVGFTYRLRTKAGAPPQSNANETHAVATRDNSSGQPAGATP